MPHAILTSPSRARPAQEAALVVEGLRKVFGTSSRPIVAADDVSFSASAGQVTTLLGTNGAGKSTTLACCQGLMKPDSGHIRLLGQQPWRGSAHLRARVGVMLQDGGLPPAQTPRSLLTHVAGLFQDPLPLSTLMDRLSLHEIARRPIRRLSGGEKQRVSLAMAILGRPEVLFLDEPSAGLDPHSRVTVFDIIRELTDDGVAVILTTHLLEDAERLSDHVVVMDRGGVLQQGTVEQLIGDTASSKAVLSFPLDVDVGQALEPYLPDATLTSPRPGTWVVEAVDTPEALTQLSRALQHAELMPQAMHLGRRSLEEAFLDLATNHALTSETEH